MSLDGATPPTPKHVLTFFAVAVGFTWLLQLPAVLAKYGVFEGGTDRFLLLAALGGFGPLLAAVLVAYIEARGNGVRALFRPTRIWRVGAHWYVVALAGFAIIAVAGTAVYRLLSGNTDVHWLYLPENAQHVSAMILIPFVEEPGWRGFALPRLQTRYSRLHASLVVGVGWTSWHAMMWILQGLTPLTFCIATMMIMAGSVIFSWIYHRTRASLLIAILAHVGVHLDNPFRAPPGAVAPLAVYTAAIMVTAAVLVLVDRPAWQGDRTLRLTFGSDGRRAS
jgi:uncharacterized protein